MCISSIVTCFIDAYTDVFIDNRRVSTIFIHVSLIHKPVFMVCTDVFVDWIDVKGISLFISMDCIVVLVVCTDVIIITRYVLLNKISMLFIRTGV